MGLFKKKKKNGKESKNWWLEYYHNGRRIRESSGTESKMKARGLLHQRKAEMAQGKTPGFYFDKITFDELAEDYLRDYRKNERKSIRRAKGLVKNLEGHFKGVRVRAIDTTLVDRYVEARQKDTDDKKGAANGTINRELAALKRMLNLAAKCTPPKIDRVPHISLLKEGSARAGFFEHSEFLALRDALPAYLRGFVTFAYRSGWRSSEMKGLTWSQVDLDQGIVTLNPGETKNEEARAMYLDDELQAVFEAQWQRRKEVGKLLPFVFTNAAGTAQLKEFRKTWKRACRGAGIGHRILHDFRRTACRNMVRAGIPERVAMHVSGHKTRSVFERYNIVNADDLKTASARQAAYLENVGATATPTPTPLQFPAKKENRGNA